MRVIGLVGLPAAGKTFLANLFPRRSSRIFSADDFVAAAYQNNQGLINKIAKEFPAAVNHGRVDKKALGETLLHSAGALTRLEKLIHPEVYRAVRKFIAQMRRKGVRAVVLDIPLLQESGGRKFCTDLIAVNTPPALRAQRLRKRHIPPPLLCLLLKRHWPIHKKMRGAFVIKGVMGRGVRAYLRRYKTL